MNQTQKNKISETLKRKFASGELICPWKGKDRSQDHRKKLSEFGKKKPINWKAIKAMNLVNKGNKYNKGRKQSVEERKMRSEIVKKNLPSTIFKKGQKPWNYIDGRSIKKSWNNRYGNEWRRIRQCAFIRDNFTCQFCGKINCLLQAHHKIPFILSRDNSLENLITLCARCHRMEEIRIMKDLKNQGVEL